MNEQILVNVTPQETRVAVVQHGAVQELHLERSSTRGIVGNVYLGKVVRVLPGMQSAFVDIGLERAAFLHVADLWEHRTYNHHQSKQGGTPPPAIEKMVFEGQTIIVQVSKDPLGTKGARLTTQISLAGRMLVHLPQDPHIGVSQRIENEGEREELRAKLMRLLPPNTGGFIIRTHAEEANDDELTADVNYLRRRWAEMLELTRQKPAPSLIYEDLTMAQRVVRDLVSDETQAILVDSKETFRNLQTFAETYAAEVLDRITLHQGERPLFELYNIEDELQKALGRRVDLKSGGYLIIDQTEALTTIDVNTGGFIGARNFEETVFKTNLEAAQAIARQLRLRNLGGIIVIDFIDMNDEAHKQAVLSELRKALDRDRARTSVTEFSALGLVEMTRKRTRESLAHLLCEPCPACQGKGQVKTAQTVAYDIMREIVREARQFNPREFRILACPAVVDLFLEEEAQHLAMLEEFVGKPITLQVDNLFSQEHYDIILT
ncbi:ribonuclease G [Limnobacter humi]|uniref:Ribonuclease G n=1 Tax=Limnobacter humi TaxID=1778671 RepID=A0ABT1WC95_9BURK|nr:ribonuclease G [Limnobacter humi]